MSCTRCGCSGSCQPVTRKAAARKLPRLTIQPIPASQPRLDHAALPALAARLTERDYQILDHLHRHRVLTTHQVQRMFFGIAQATRKRMTTLFELNAVTRFRPWAGYGAGSAPIHWALGKAGAAALAARHAITVKELGYDPEIPVAVSSRLNHQIGVNDFFSHLHHDARYRPDAHLRAWQSEKECTKIWGDLARPDAYGCWSEGGRQIDFFLEHDTGTEPLKRVADKLHDYLNLAEATRIITPVLFWLPSAARETHLRKLLTATDLPVATAVHTTHNDGPAGACWLPAPAEAGQQRMRLAHLDTGWPHLTLGRNPDQPTTTTDDDAFLDRIFGEEETGR
ncbi:replication-relaxation family protein [Nonomuraea sp. NN258]|uniref:replication-relaxation family protein n=1 Tax=Nonomuraea antri TaxID=2730852 RepID=UPI001568E6B3|nr:replication-relaxation family protein [Nonomuraea antri]NRQ38437.1 replication-relaxation family protein [Nonomuraea antri]